MPSLLSTIYAFLAPHNILSYSTNYQSITSWLLFMLAFYIAAFAFQCFDRYRILSQYKVYRSSAATPTFSQMLLRVIFNQCCLLLPAMILFENFSLTFKSNPNPPSNLVSFFTQFTLTTFLHEVAFYIFHSYVLHSSWGFQNLNHALHHTSKTHSAISAMYMSPPDFLLEIIIPYLFPLCLSTLCNYANNFSCLFILLFGAFGGLYEHSGYNIFPDIHTLDTSVHALHHTHHHCSFANGVGAPSLVDPFMGTVCGSIGRSAMLGRKAISFVVPHPE